MNRTDDLQHPSISLVAPFYNEESNIEVFFQVVIPILDALGQTYEIICVNDGSSDATLLKLITQAENNPRLTIIDLSRNFGKEAALSAGLAHADGEAVIVIDSDLQDPPELIPEMVTAWQQGFDVVLAKRRDRSSDSLLKRISANLFYKVHNSLAQRAIPENVGDYRLMSRRVVQALNTLPERTRFMKGIFAWLGYDTTVIEFTRQPRAGGDTKWNYWSLWNFALEGITSFSSIPLRVWTYFGFIISILGFLYITYYVVKTFIFGIDLPGYASLLSFIIFFGGIQLISLGVIGEYLSRVFIEVKQRPLYIIRDIYNIDRGLTKQQSGTENNIIKHD